MFYFVSNGPPYIPVIMQNISYLPEEIVLGKVFEQDQDQTFPLDFSPLSKTKIRLFPDIGTTTPEHRALQMLRYIDKSYLSLRCYIYSLWTWRILFLLRQRFEKYYRDSPNKQSLHPSPISLYLFCPCLGSPSLLPGYFRATRS